MFLDTSAETNLMRELYGQEHDIWALIGDMDIAITPIVVNGLSNS